MEEKLLKIINHYGFKNQLRKFNEETYELVEAIRNYEEQKIVCELCCEKLHTDKEKEHIAEELADCMVLLEQFKLYYGITSKEITEIFWSKIDRQLNRIEKEVKDE